jgi:hypothetical protein
MIAGWLDLALVFPIALLIFALYLLWLGCHNKPY